MAIEVLLIEDVLDLGRAGEVHRVAPGFARNYLFPKGFAVTADKNTLRKQERLQAERAQRAESDRAESERLAAQLEGITLTCIVKVDPTGHMYGSVSVNDLLHLFEQAGHTVDKHFIHLPHPIKETGLHKLQIRLKEGVACECKVQVTTQEQLASAGA